MSYYSELIRFLEQAKTNDLKTKSFESSYKNLVVKVSFGKGNPAKIPWISFLNGNNKTSNGIYPVYLYYKELEILILAFGVSETNAPSLNWKLESPKLIADYFEENYSKQPDRYGSSYVFKVYQVSDLPNEDVINDELNSIIDIYLSQDQVILDPINKTDQFDIDNFFSHIKDTGLAYSKFLIVRFCSSIITKPFVILTGLSGSGKTKLAQAFVQWICQDKSQYCVVPVGADWTNREPLLGYPNALRPEEYVKPDSGVLDLIIQANAKSELPHFLILDEMNLSHVERYFADFLSAMESNEEISLHSNVVSSQGNDVEAQLKVPPNLFFIGTVNIDETTNMFSPKVLDRANTIEFRVTQDEMKTFLSNIKEVKIDGLSGKGAEMAKSFLAMASNKDFIKDEAINSSLIQFFGELKKIGAEFGYRSATEILRLIHQLTVLDSTLTKLQKIDIAIMQKLLPKLYGSRRKLCPILETLGSLCITIDVQIIKDVFEKPDFDFNGENIRFPLSLEKIARMYRGAIDNGFSSFAEA
jgi:5-methylcytosine-specific restriction protein B